MTRETKIGLLVGLAFIIVIGILLSDYNRIETQNAPLLGVVKNMKEGVGSPGSDAPARNTIVYPPGPATPRQPVPTTGDLAAGNSPPDEVVVRPSAGRVVPAGRNDGANRIVIGPGASDPQNGSSPSGVSQDIETIARDHGMDIVPAGPASAKPLMPVPPAAANAPVAAGKSYTAQPGDTVSKMAGRFMGGNTSANRDAIVKANPSLQKNINNVIVGKTYVIPNGIASTATVAAAPATQLPLRAQGAPVLPVNHPSASPTHWYTVKENDSLWRIAQDQLGDGNAVAAIKELNKDILKGGDGIRPAMRLRLPAKPLASAS